MTIRSKTLLTIGALLACAHLASTAASANSLHYSVTENFTATGFDTDAKGKVQAVVRQKGKGHLQRLRVSVANLDPATPYVLFAVVGDDSDFVAVADFTTSKSGRAVVLQQERPFEKIRHPQKKNAMPEAFDSLTDVRALAVATTNGDVVLTANLSDSPSVEFELTSVFDNAGTDPEAVGCVAVAVQHGFLQFRLFAAGQSSEFTLCVNDSPVGTYAANAGRINVGAFPTAAPSPLAFRKMCLRNADNEIVLESTLP